MRRRRGIALLVAMLFIVSLMGLAAIFMQLSRDAFDRVHTQQTMLANVAMLGDIKYEVIAELVDLALGAAKDSCQLASDQSGCEEEVKGAIFGGMYHLPLSFVQGDARTMLTCAPAGIHLDINRLKLDQNASSPEANTPVHHRRSRFERYLQDEHRLYATWQLLELLDFVFDASGQTNAYLKNDDRLFIADDRFPRGAIKDPRHFYQIVRDYALLSHDEAALEIGWGDFLSFGSVGERLDFRHLASDTCHLVFGQDRQVCEPESGLETLADLRRYSDESNLSVHHFGVQMGFNPIMRCRVLWQSGSLTQSYRFAYKIDRKELLEFTMAP